MSLTLAGAGLAASVAWRVDPEISGREPDRKILVKPIAVEDERREPVTLVLGWTTGAALRWPAAAGLVTSVRSATSIANGDVIATVDRLGVIALRTDQPLHRNLALGDRGPDVRDLRVALQAIGLLDAEADRDTFTAAMQTAVRTLNVRLGSTSAEFDVSRAVWLPSTPFEVESLDLDVGAAAPASGTEFAREVPRPTQARVVAADSQDPAVAKSVTWQDGLERVVEMPDGVLTVDATGSIAPTQLPSSIAPGTESVPGVTVRLANPRTGMALPPSAVRIALNGGVCVFGEDESAVAVEIVGGSPGVSIVTGRLPSKVIANPALSLGDRGC